MQPFHDGSHCVAAHFLTGDRRIGVAYLGEEHPQVVVDLGGAADGGAGVAGIDPLLYGDGGRDAGDTLDWRFGHSPEELTGK